MEQIGIVVIGRNEGERLRRCLESVGGAGCTIVYVDSGSTDGSVALAKKMGAEVVELDMSRPFTAARGRNAGFERLMAIAPATEFVQFVDGDCELAGGWMQRAADELRRRPEAAVVCGRRRERFPEASIYNRLCDIEWDTPVGQALACGGDAMMRASSFRMIGGFNPAIPAGEEPEMCHRLRQAGCKIVRVDAEMTVHDAAMLHFGQWWRRSVRNGYAAYHGWKHFGVTQWTHQVVSARIWAVGWPAAVGVGAAAGALGGVTMAAMAGLVVLLAWPAQVLRIALRQRRRGTGGLLSLQYGLFIMLAKWAEVFGQMMCMWRSRRGQDAPLIEYKVVPCGQPERP